eukprot:Skav221483  [mRNA]  locus=scaffold1514:113628:115860:+ [translate_table: standard]
MVASTGSPECPQRNHEPPHSVDGSVKPLLPLWEEPGKAVEAVLRGNVPTREIYVPGLTDQAMLEVAHRFPDHGLEARSACLRALLVNPDQSLREAWTLNSRILEELLALAGGATCRQRGPIGHWRLRAGQDDHLLAGPAGPGPLWKAAQDNVSFGGFNEERFQEIRSPAALRAATSSVVEQMPV